MLFTCMYTWFALLCLSMELVSGTDDIFKYLYLALPSTGDKASDMIVGEFGLVVCVTHPFFSAGETLPFMELSLHFLEASEELTGDRGCNMIGLSNYEAIIQRNTDGFAYAGR